MNVRITLVADGPTDRALLPIIQWTVEQVPDCTANVEFGDYFQLRRRPRTLSDRIRACVDLYPCDLVIVHRDAERESPDSRFNEINDAMEKLPGRPHVCVVPVRMTEAWLLLDATAIRRAAGNPNGNQPLTIPPSRQVEGIPDPKELLSSLLREASGLHGRRRKKFDERQARHRVAQLIDDFTGLRALSAFRRFETDLRSVMLALKNK